MRWTGRNLWVKWPSSPRQHCASSYENESSGTPPPAYAALAAGWDADDAALVCHLGAVAAYDEWVPAFEVLFARQNQGDASSAAWPRFLRRCAS